MLKITIGTDPEFSLIDEEAQRRTSAHGLIPGTKQEPHKVNGGAVQIDGAMVEYNTEPASSAEEFIANNLKVMEALRNMIPKKYTFDFKPAVFFDDIYFEKIPDNVKELGCSPDFDAYKKGAMNPRPIPPDGKENMRTCSGHIHIGWTKDADVLSLSHRWDCCLIVRALDKCVLPYLKKFDKDTNRASLYGKPGAFRPKSYGVEWRVPSNAWLNHPKLWGWLFEACKAVVIAVYEGKYNPDLEPFYMTQCPDWFPKFDISWIEKDKVDGKKKDKIIETGVRISYTAGTISFDLNLDLPNEDFRNYSRPSELPKSVTNVSFV